MAEVKWIKLSTGIFDNRKIKQIEKMPDGDAMIVIWLKLLILAGEVNDGGAVYFTRDIPYTDQLLATQFDRPLPTVQLALQTFTSFGMIEIVDNVILVSNWERYQSVDGMEKIKEQGRKRVAEYRERKKLAGGNVTRNVTCNVTVTQCNATDKKENRTEEDIDIERERDIPPKRFVPPTVDEVREYCDERKNNVDPQHFVDYYETRGWRVHGGVAEMVDWKACVRSWERNGYPDKKKSADTETEASFDVDKWEERVLTTVPKLKKKGGSGKR